MKQTGAYYRSSTKMQEDSVKSQQYSINQYALKYGILIDVEYPEPFVSARKNKLDERPQMKQLMTDIRNGKIGKLLVYKRDRLARKVDEHLELYKLFKQHKVEVHFIAENEPPMRFDIFGELIELFVGVMSQREGEQINMRIADTKISKFLSGEMIGNLPYGYFADKEKTKIVKNDSELDVVKVIYKEWNSDRYNNTEKLATYLRDKGIKRGAKDWTSNNIIDLLTNPIYMGLRIANYNNRQITRDAEELAVITKEEFDLAQNLLDKRKKHRKSKKQWLYLLSGLVFCEKCEEERLKEQEMNSTQLSMQPLINYVRMKDGEEYATYECREHKYVINQNDLECVIYERTKNFFSKLINKHFEELYEKHKKKILKDFLKLKDNYLKELDQAEQKLVSVTNRWIQNESNVNKEKVLKVSKKVKGIKENLYDLEVKMQLVKEVPKLVGEIKEEILKEENWGQLSFARKQELIKDLVQFIFITQNTTRIIFKHPYLEESRVNV